MSSTLSVWCSVIAFSLVSVTSGCGDGGEGGSDGGGGSDSSGGAGGTPAVACGAVEIQPAIFMAAGDDPVSNLQLTALQGDPDHVAMVATFTSSGTTTTKFVNVNAWASSWPAFLGPLSDTGAPPTAQSIAVSEGRDFGYALLETDGIHPLEVGWFAYEMPLPQGGQGATMLSGPADSRAAFVTRSPESGHYFGLISPVGNLYVYYDPPSFGSSGVKLLDCARTNMSAAAFTRGDHVLVAASSGQALGECDTLPTTEPNRVHFLSLSFASDSHGDASLLFEELYDEPVTHVAIANAGEDEAWLGWQVGGSILVARVDEAGAVQSGPVTVSEASRGPFAMVMRGDELVVASAEGDPSGPADIQVTAVSASGATRELAAFDTEEAPWSGGLSMLTSPDSSKVMVVYESTLGSSAARATARRLDCEP
ncbi:MAG: hypothetical protein U0271_02875 [Polyangiaceae bacterium]